MRALVINTETNQPRARETEQPLGDIIRFHGHMCPGLAMGIRATSLGYVANLMPVSRSTPGTALT